MLTAGSTAYLQCVPGTYEPATFPAEIRLDPEHRLIGKFYYPDAGPSGPGFAPNSLPGVLLTHGFGETYADVEDQAAALSGLEAGRWTARVHLDDGNDYRKTFVVP